jgi:membrane-associated phospholipid phosphatase
VRWPFLVYATAIVALAYSRRRLRLPRPPMVPLVSTTPLAVAAALPRGRLQYAATWTAYVWLFKVAWEIPYDKPEKLRSRLRLHYPIRIDTTIGRGVPPGVRLQSALRDPPRLTFLDKALTGAHYGLWLAPHAVLGWMLLRDDRRFPRAAGRLAAVYHITTLGYWYLPTAPPWWASEREGLMGGRIQRVTREVGASLGAKLSGKERPTGGPGADDRFQQGNPWGSMPSDALPAAAITARSLAEISPVAGAVGWACTALDGFALVYLGEHYVIDLIAGLLVVEAVWRAEPAVLPLVRIGVDVLRGLERLVDSRTGRRAA